MKTIMRVRLGLSGGALLILFIGGFVFIGGSSVFDLIVNRRAPEAQIFAAVSPQLPEALRRKVRLVWVGYSPNDPRPHGIYVAHGALSLLSSLYTVADFEKSAASYGDNPAAFADAVSRRNKLPAELAPEIPDLRSRQTLYALAQPSGAQFSIEFAFSASKVPRRWALLDCFYIWKRYRTWQIANIQWEAPKTDISRLRSKAEIGRDALFLDEITGQTLVRQYVKKRQDFIKAVGDQEWGSIERAADNAIRREIGRSLNHPNVFAVKSVTMARPQVPPSRTGGSLAAEATVVIEQVAELFRESKVDVLGVSESALKASFASARQVAGEFFPEANLIPPATPVLYESISPRLASWVITVQFVVQGPSDRPIIEDIKWMEEPKLPVPPFIEPNQAGDNAVFQSTDSALRSVKSYTAEVESYIQRVQEATTKLEKRWGSDREAWRLIMRAIVAHGGQEKIRRCSAFMEQISGKRFNSDGKEFAFRGTRRVILPFRWRDDFSFTSDKISLTQTETLDVSGYWQIADEKMHPANLATPEGVNYQRRMSYARNILWNLVADDSRQFKIFQSTDAGPPKVSIATEEFPDTTITFDPSAGYITSASYIDKGGNAPRPFEARFSDFKNFDGLNKASKVVILLDGKLKEEFTIDSSQLSAALKPEQFRNPYSPGKPFRGNSSRQHSLTIINGSALTTAILVCLDDDPTTVALGARAQRTIQLAEGEHEVAIVSWTPQINLKQPHRIETKPLRLSLHRNQELTVVTDKILGGSLRWEIK